MAANGPDGFARHGLAAGTRPLRRVENGRGSRDPAAIPLNTPISRMIPGTPVVARAKPSVSQTPPLTALSSILPRYDGLLLDAYGVLVNGTGVLDGAERLVDRLNRSGLPYRVVTNDASRTEETTAARFAALGLDIPVERILTSGSLLKPHFDAMGLRGRRCTVLGPEDSRAYAARAGGRLVPPREPFEVLVIGDESGIEPFLETLNQALSTLLARLDDGHDVHLVLPNPDLIFPAGPNEVGITGGALAALFEAVIEQRYPQRPQLRFHRLGKPHPALFEHALAVLGCHRPLMIGDQLDTDIAGAAAFGIDSALYLGGLARRELPAAAPRPTYLLETLA